MNSTIFTVDFIFHLATSTLLKESLRVTFRVILCHIKVQVINTIGAAILL